MRRKACFPDFFYEKSKSSVFVSVSFMEPVTTVYLLNRNIRSFYAKLGFVKREQRYTAMRYKYDSKKRDYKNRKEA